MSFKCGIVGLPNVGKSTLFNALTKTMAAEAANYPFCTIEPNIGIVSVPDERLTELAKIAQSAKVIPTQIEFVDIAGLVSGASTGEGLGNKFLGHIREVDAIIHVLRCFDDANITHVHGKIDPVHDAEVIETELILADLESVEKRLPALQKKARGLDPEAKEKIVILEKAIKILEAGQRAHVLYQDYPAKIIDELQLLSTKPIIYLANVAEDEAGSGNNYSLKLEERAKSLNLASIVISSKIESEIAILESEEEKQEFLTTLGLKETGLNKVIRKAYDILNLKSYFTVGPKETRAWTFPDGTNAQNAAGIIHTDFARGFIRAEVIAYDDYMQYQGETGAKDAGKMRLEGKEYLVQDGDVIHFRFNV